MQRCTDTTGGIYQLGIDPGANGERLTHDRQIVDPGGPEDEAVGVEAVEAFAALYRLVLPVCGLLVAVKLKLSLIMITKAFK